MTCKNCIHVEVCRYYTNELANANGIPLKVEEIEGLLECDDCEHFKDRSRFVELPCKLGDTVYYFNSAGEIFLQKVSGFIVNFVGILVDSDVMFYSYMMGDRFFSTYEEAKQVLKEREANANDLPQSDNHS